VKGLRRLPDLATRPEVNMSHAPLFALSQPPFEGTLKLALGSLGHKTNIARASGGWEGRKVGERRVVKRVQSKDGKHRLDLIERSDGLFEFVGHSETTEDGDTFWEPTLFSGIHDSLQSAERQALVDMVWLRDEKSN
jgi:hypothetical protein